jgi:hypothetical protein
MRWKRFHEICTKPRRAETSRVAGSGRTWKQLGFLRLHWQALQDEYRRCIKNCWEITRHDASNAGQWLAFCEAMGCILEVNVWKLQDRNLKPLWSRGNNRWEWS